MMDHELTFYDFTRNQETHYNNYGRVIRKCTMKPEPKQVENGNVVQLFK